MRNLIASAFLAAGLMLGSTALAATPQAATAESGTTAAAPVVQREVVGRTMIDAPIEQMTVSRPVSYAGLNLANTADIKVIDQRIHDMAKADCAELRDQSNALMNPTIGGGSCVRTAVRDARSTLSTAVSAAKTFQ